MRRNLIYTALVYLIGATAASAQATSDPSTTKGGTYRVEPGHTQIVFSISHMGFTYYSGTFSDASGSLILNPSDLAKTVLSVKVPVSSVSTTSSRLTDELKGKDWFDGDHFPDATFKSTTVTTNGNGAATIEGDLTLHGVTHPVKLDAHFVGAGQNMLSKKYNVGFEATGTIKRSDFGVKRYLPAIGDDVRLTIAGAFEKQD